jgi:antirestriction protein ArdC
MSRTKAGSAKASYKAAGDAQEKQDVYTRVTERIIADLEQGVRSWLKPWHSEHAAGKITRPLRHNGTPYNGINILLLWGEALAKGYAAPIWMTYKQAQELGANVRKGEKGSLVVYANRITKTETNDAGEDTEREIPFMKGYTVFNVEQVDGLPAHYYAQPVNPLPLAERIEAADAFMTGTGATIHHGGNQAFYAPSRDVVQLPPFEAFKDKESYYATALHELTHWTKAKGRLERDFSAKRFGDTGYAREELVAELGAAFLCADLGITPDIREDHAAYLGHWLSVLKEDKRAIFSAAAHAQRAADYLKGLQPNAQAAEEVQEAQEEERESAAA